MSEWQPIETAPTDGSGLLLWIPDWNTAMVAWIEEGRYWVPVRSDGRMGLGARPTHWLPVPAPPETPA